MSKITSKFDKVLNTSQFHGKMVHEPDSSTETYQNSADITTPPADYVGNYQRNRIDLVSQCHNVSSELP